MARWRSLLLCAALVASAGFTAAAEEAADAAADAGPPPEFAKMRVKELQGIIAARGEECKGCSEKADLVARAAEVWHLPIKAAPEEKKEEKTPPNKDDVEAMLRDLKIKMPGMKVFGKDDMEKMRREMGDKKFAAGAGAGEL